jgi:hypothetical protein
VDQTDFRSDQVSTNSPILHFNTSFIVFECVGGWPSPLKGAALAIRGLSRDSPRVPARRVTRARGYPRLSPRQPAGYPPRNQKVKWQVVDLSFFFLWFCRMYVHWREREHEAANEAVAADPNVMAALTQCGLVKFFYVRSCVHNQGC